MKKVAVVCKLMPLYRLGVYKELSMYTDIEFTFFGDQSIQNGIDVIEKDQIKRNNIRYISTTNYFYKPELILWQTKILRYILKSDFDIFIFEGAVSHIPYIIFSILCKVVKKKVVFWTHGLKGVDKGIKKIIRLLYFKYLPDLILLYGNFQKEIMIKSGISLKKLFVIYNSLDTTIQQYEYSKVNYEDVKKKKQEIFSNTDLFTLIFIGRLVKNKKVIEILKLIKDLKVENINLNCIFIGEGKERKNMEIFANANKIVDNIHLCGSINDESEIVKYFCMSDLMISPGNVGLNCIHSLTYNVPVITHDCYLYQNPEVEIIENYKNGILFRYNDYSDMKAKVIYWINNIGKNSSNNEYKNSVIKKYNSKEHAKRIRYAIEKIL